MRVGPYEVLRELGRGGVGVVFAARALDGSEVALKVLLRSDSRATLGRFERERRLLANLGDGFVPLLDAGESPQGPYLVMPLVPGGTLRERLLAGPSRGRSAERSPTPPRSRAADGRPLVSDLGLGKLLDPGASFASLSATGEMRGTLGYAPAEQLEDAKNVGPAADVFALGAILFECLTGAGPFEADSPHERLAAVVEGRHPPLRGLRHEVPAHLARVVERALALRPEQRFRDAGELVRALEARPARRAWVAVPALAVALGAAWTLLVARPREARAPSSPAGARTRRR